MAEMKRQVAYKVRISDIINSSYVVLEGWDPNYIIVDGKKISRVNVIGTVIEKDENSLMIDDGSGQISLRNFDDNRNYDKYSQGDIINVVGKIREYNSDKYIIDEFVKKTDSRWLVLRKKELDILKKMNLGEDATNKPLAKRKETKSNSESDEAEEELVEDTRFKNDAIDDDIIEIEERIDNTPKTMTQKVIEVIKKIDAGDGADIEEIIRQLGDCESTIALMIKKGDIFENRAGKVKIL